MIIGMRLSGVDGLGEICAKKYWYLDYGNNIKQNVDNALKFE
jgi:hypothetical protein